MDGANPVDITSVLPTRETNSLFEDIVPFAHHRAISFAPVPLPPIPAKSVPPALLPTLYPPGIASKNSLPAYVPE